MINKAAGREVMRGRVRPFDNAAELADNTAREMYLVDEMSEVLALAREVCAERDVHRIPDIVLPDCPEPTESNEWVRHAGRLERTDRQG